MVSRSQSLAPVLVALVLLAPGCTRAPDEVGSSPALVDSRPNLILVTLCSFRRNRLGVERYRRDLTPFLDGLVEQGVYFENAVAASSWTKPTTASLLTGVTPGVHQMTDYYELSDKETWKDASVRVLSEHFETLPEALGAAGYRTICRVNNPHAGRVFQMTQGCDDIGATEGRSTQQMISEFGEWLERGEGTKPFFFFLMTLHVHAPYKPSYESYTRWSGESVPRDGFDAHRDEVFQAVWDKARSAPDEVPASLRRSWVDLYDAAVADLDTALAELVRILDVADVRDDTVIAITADHGEAFWENGMVEHGLQLSETLVGVPLIVVGPGATAGRRVREVVRTIDIYPTLAELGAAEPPAILQGESLVSLFTASAESSPRSAYSQLGQREAVRLRAHKLVVGPTGRSLYDVEADPAEEHDLLAELPEVKRLLDNELADWREQEEGRRALLPKAPTADLSSDTTERLRALGYLD